MIRILATGDNHFDERSPRWEETLRVHEQIAATVERERPDLFLGTGDTWERASTPLERLRARDFWRAVCRVCPAVLVRGNHDAPEDLGGLLGRVKTDHTLHVVEDARVLTPLPGVSVAAVAWPSRVGAVDDGVAREQLRALLSALGTQMQDAPVRLLLGHFDVSGAENGAGQPVIGGSLRVALADLALAHAHAVVMGHIHKAQGWSFDGAPIVYCGSPVAHDFGETEEKTLLDLRIDAGRATVARIPTGARRMVHVAGEYDETTGQIALEGFDPASLSGSELRLRYRVRAEHLEAARRRAAEIAAAWTEAGAARVKLEHDPVVTVRARAGAGEVARAVTLVDMLFAYWASTGEVPDADEARELTHMIESLEAA